MQPFEQLNLTPSTPTVSVVMAVKNGGELVRESVESILQQTLQDFEFIIINDGSQDNTLTILQQFSDARIRIYTQENQGLAPSLNRGIALASGQYIARQDHDDISRSTRLEKQVDFFKKNTQCGLLGTGAEIWNEQGTTGRYHHHPTQAGRLAFELLFNNPFVHTSWMFPRAIIQKVGDYTTDPSREPPEDYELVSRIAKIYPVANLEEQLVIYREVHNSISSVLRPNQTASNAFLARLAKLSAENLAHVLGLDASDPNMLNFGALVHRHVPGLVGNPNLKYICELVFAAAEKIARQYAEPEVMQALETKIALLESSYYINSGRAPWLNKTQYRIKNKYRRLFLRERV